MLDELDAGAHPIAQAKRPARRRESKACVPAARAHNTVPTLDRTVTVIVAAWIAAIAGSFLFSPGVGGRAGLSAARGPKGELSSVLFLPHAPADEGGRKGASFPEPRRLLQKPSPVRKLKVKL